MHHKRRVYLINRRFQLRFAFYVCSWLVALSFVYPLIISNIFDFLFSYLVVDPNGPEISYLEGVRLDLLSLLIIMQVVMLVLSFFISIFMSHKVAGPLYKLGKFFQEAKAGNLSERIAFRKRDYFPELATQYNEMMDSIRNRINGKSQALSTVTHKLETILAKSDPALQSDLNSLLSDLRKIQKSD
jgi:methyl-accepting chemotaxis protein